MKRDTILLRRQNRLSSADQLKEKSLRISLRSKYFRTKSFSAILAARKLEREQKFQEAPIYARPECGKPFRTGTLDMQASYESNTELLGNTPWFTLREVIMEIIYRIVLWTVVFCHYTWSQEGRNILFSLHQPKRTREVLCSVVCTARAHNKSSF